MANKLFIDAKLFLKQISNLMKKYYVYIDDLSSQRYFEYDALYKIDFEAQKVLVSLQDWCHTNKIDVRELWKTNLNMFQKIEPIIVELYEKFQQTFFYELDTVSLNRDNFEGYYYFINVYKVFILMPYLIASLLIKNNKINFDSLAFHLTNYLPIFERYDLIIDKVKKYTELGNKKLLFSNFGFDTFFNVLDNLSNLSLFVTMGSRESRKIIFKFRVYHWKSITMMSSFLFVILIMITILVIKFN